MFITLIPQITHIYISTMPAWSLFLLESVWLLTTHLIQFRHMKKKCKKHLLSKQALGEDLIWIENYL